MAAYTSFEEYVLDQVQGLDGFETKRMFGGLALLYQGVAFAKVKHEKVWLKTDESNRAEFESRGMKQYAYGKDGSRHLHFHETPPEVLENAEEFMRWVKRAVKVALEG